MTAFEQMTRYGFGELHMRRDAASGLRAIVAIHDTKRGPALGGCRFVSYESEEMAVTDALRLARGMTYKAALADLPLGGGKSVIVKPQSGVIDRQALFRAFGQFVDDLGGRYITAADSGTGPSDMDIIRDRTAFVTGSGKGVGDPSPYTALGVRRGIEATGKVVLGRNSVEGLHVAIQGVGQVGYFLCRELKALGARLTVADIDAEKTKRAADEFGATIVSNETIVGLPVDVYAPCALGGAINDQTLSMLQCKIVAGGANNQLLEPRCGEELARRGIFYAPDYAINAGGLIHVASEAVKYGADEVNKRTMAIYDTIALIAERSMATHQLPHVVADKLAEERLV